jgi:hypothetical protein
MNVAIKYIDPIEKNCSIWNNECPYAIECVNRNNDKIHSLLQFKSKYKEENLANIVARILLNLEEILDLR